MGQEIPAIEQMASQHVAWSRLHHACLLESSDGTTLVSSITSRAGFQAFRWGKRPIRGRAGSVETKTVLPTAEIPHGLNDHTR
jgi:hypothetical protein